ncbi:hypothetical protein VKA52_12670 [Halobacillus sp. HZG1]|uniref:phage tail protein n=1 Tax=Halobacillus sp. HZG1 TaxID=3111769 RepID=UPI002DB8824F|nr:hypothetical protein [Halobacillus sp. HZG1]MEC3884579.1 hypothetical protein [Halobacillus sp. HZG1]
MAEYSIEAELKANASKYKRAIQSAKRVTEKFKRESETIKEARLGADTSPLKRNLKRARNMMKLFARNKTKAEVDVGVDDSEAKRKMGLLIAVKQALSRRIVIPVEARIDKFQKTMGRIANSIQAFDTVAGNTFRGLGLMVSSSLVPIIASMIPAIMAVGNALGVVGSGAVALAAAFGLAGSAAIAYGAAAAPTIQSIIDGTAESTKENIKAAKQLGSLKNAWRQVQEALAPEVAVAFGNAMEGIETVIQSLNPMFTNIADTVARLSESFKTFFESSSAQSFFNYLNGSAAPILEKIVNGITGFIEGLMNLTVAFGPLTDFMAQGFEDMGGSFASFTEKVAKSKKLQQFIQYIKENLPVIRQIFGDVFKGIINLLVAFNDNSALIFTSLSTMAARFREWSAAISESDGFQKFIQYVQENGPKVISLIGNVISFIINLGIALAPLGSKVMEIANSILSWTNSMLENYPVIGKIVAIATLLGGALIALIPNIVAIASLFSGLGAKLVSLFTRVNGVLPLMTKLRTAFLAVTGPVGIAIAVFTGLIALFVMMYNRFNWFRQMVHQTWAAIQSSFSTALSFIQQVVTSVVSAVVTFVGSQLKKFRGFWDENGAQISSLTKKYFQLVLSVIQTVMSAILGVFQAIWPILSNTVKVTWSLIKTIVSTGIDILLGLFEAGLAILRGDWSGAWQAIEQIGKNIWRNIESFFSNIDLTQMGRDIIQGLLNGISSMFGSIKRMISRAADLVPNWLKKKLGIASPSKVTTRLGEFTGEGMVVGAGKMLPKIAKRAKEMAGAITPKEKDMTITPTLQTTKISSSLRKLKKNSASKVKSAVSASVEYRDKQPANIQLTIGRSSYRAFVEDITNEQELREELNRNFA